METENKDLIVIQQNTTNEPLRVSFPFCLFKLQSYKGINALFGIFFWLSVVYFIYGIANLFIWNNTFFGILWNFFTKPIYLIYHICVFSFVYCVTWAVFDLVSFKNCVIRLLLIIASIVYVILPADIIPDITPFLGQADDIVAIIIGLTNAISLFKNRTITNNKRVNNE